MCFEVKQALLAARGRGGGTAMTARDALRLGTRGSAGVLGRTDIGSLEPGKRADVAIWRTDGLELGGAEDLPAALVFSAPHRVDTLLVGGREVVRDGALVNADEAEIAREHRVQAGRCGMWRRGDEVVYRHRSRDGRYLFGKPLRILEDTPAQVVGFIPGGTEIARPTLADGSDLRAAPLTERWSHPRVPWTPHLFGAGRR